MAAVTQKRARRIWVLAAVVALHIAVCWMLLEATRPLKIRIASSRPELTYISLDMPARKPAPALHLQPPVLDSTATLPLNQPRPPKQPSEAAPAEEDNAIHPPIDWANELNRTARDSASGESAPQPRAFGQPHVAPKPPAKPPEFGWSRSRTHRVDRGPDGTAIHLGDHCVINLFSQMPLVTCSPGKKEANGDLFKHMRDPPQPGDWKDPQ